MAHNAVMGVFAQLHIKTYKEITHEFLASFEDNLDMENVKHACTFTITGNYLWLTLQGLCNIFGFENVGFRKAEGEYVAAASGTW